MLKRKQIVVNTVIIRLKHEYKFRIVFSLIHGQQKTVRKELFGKLLVSTVLYAVFHNISFTVGKITFKFVTIQIKEILE